jgi:hypothetical protein
MITGSNLANFWERRGERVVEMYGISGHITKGPFFSSLPFDLTVNLHPDQIDEILRRRHIGGLRFPVSNGNGLDSGLYVCARRIQLSIIGSQTARARQNRSRALVRRGRASRTTDLHRYANHALDFWILSASAK